MTQTTKTYATWAIREITHDGEWWGADGDWTPASEEAMTFESREEAQEYADANVSRNSRVVGFDEAE